MKKILCFQLEIEGHALEYITHLYTWAKQEKDISFTFCIPQNKLTNHFFEITKNDNIHFLSLNKEKRNISPREKCILLRNYIKCVKPTDVILLSFDQYFPFFHFLLPKNVNYTSFLYYIYVYNWKTLNLKNKIKTIVNYWLLFKNNSVKNILICNGTNENVFFNRKFETSKFINIVDPIAIDTYCSDKEIADKITFLHMGAMNKRKGTLDILDAIIELPESVCSKVKFLFLGRISNDIRKPFYDRLKMIRNDVELIIYDDFCSYEQIQQACIKSSYLLMPYYGTSQSSGMLAYASAFNIPVVATNRGMIKKLVKKYQLGYLIENNVASIREFICASVNNSPLFVPKKYVEKNSILNFIETFHKCFSDNNQ